ncbi:MAG: hypothetical protein ACE5E4_05625 [Candidatus Binatia bacterium]
MKPINLNRGLGPLLVTCLVVLPPAMAATAVAQDITVLSPLKSEYRLGGFVCTPPAVAGWRELGSNSKAFQLAYAEVMPGDAIKTRGLFAAEVFAIPAPAEVVDVAALASLAHAQQIQNRGDKVIAFSRVAEFDGVEGMQSFTLVSGSKENPVYETFFVSLAPDKSEYFVGRLTTEDEDFREQPYFGSLKLVLGTLRRV